MPWKAFTLEACIRATAANYSVYEGGVEALEQELRTLRAIEAAAKRYVRAEAAAPAEILRGLLDTRDPTVGAEQQAAWRALQEAVGADPR